jgi:hypothetical protein
MSSGRGHRSMKMIRYFRPDVQLPQLTSVLMARRMAQWSSGDSDGATGADQQGLVADQWGPDSGDDRKLGRVALIPSKPSYEPLSTWTSGSELLTQGKTSSSSKAGRGQVQSAVVRLKNPTHAGPGPVGLANRDSPSNQAFKAPNIPLVILRQVRKCGRERVWAEDL